MTAVKSNFGESLNISLFGESHSEAIGVVINGLAPGIRLDMDRIHSMLDKRKPKGAISTARREADAFKLVCGYFNGYTTGTPLCAIIENQSQKSGDYEKTKDLMRPAHADFTANEKYLGYQDYRGGGHFSGRITAPIVIAGAICIQILNAKGIKIGTHIKECAGICDVDFGENLSGDIELLNNKYFPVLSDAAEESMTQAIEQAHSDGDSVGGILESIVAGMPTGIGEPFFNSIESRISQLLFSIPAVKGVEFGAGFAIAKMRGSSANDDFCFDGERVCTQTNNNGGINGGISNGMPIVVRTVIKPTPSIYKPQNTVNIKTKQAQVLEIVGRHDPAIIHRARIVADSMLGIALVDLFSERYGYMWQR